MNHFNVFQGKSNLRVMIGDFEERAIRPHVLGRFRDLVAATVRHPAMLRYLDNERNAANRINENYARELMELHTLGVDGGYTQKDVQEVARALTGWMFNRQTGEFVFNPAIHDAGEKMILGHKFPAGRGQEEGEEVLDL